MKKRKRAKDSESKSRNAAGGPDSVMSERGDLEDLSSTTVSVTSQSQFKSTHEQENEPSSERLQRQRDVKPQFKSSILAITTKINESDHETEPSSISLNSKRIEIIDDSQLDSLMSEVAMKKKRRKQNESIYHQIVVIHPNQSFLNAWECQSFHQLHRLFHPKANQGMSMSKRVRSFYHKARVNLSMSKRIVSAVKHNAHVRLKSQLRDPFQRHST